MNNTMVDEKEMVKHVAATTRYMLREDGFTNEEIDLRKDNSGYIIFPDDKTRNDRRALRINKMEKEESDKLFSQMQDPNKKIGTEHQVCYKLVNGICEPYIFTPSK
jgi:cell fate regulator YaaT (PSP1 superfamily)